MEVLLELDYVLLNTDCCRTCCQARDMLGMQPMKWEKVSAIVASGVTRPFPPVIL